MGKGRGAEGWGVGTRVFAVSFGGHLVQPIRDSRDPLWLRFVWGAFVGCCFACGCVLELVVCRVRPGHGRHGPSSFMALGSGSRVCVLSAVEIFMFGL